LFFVQWEGRGTGRGEPLLFPRIEENRIEVRVWKGREGGIGLIKHAEKRGRGKKGRRELEERKRKAETTQFKEKGEREGERMDGNLRRGGGEG